MINDLIGIWKSDPNDIATQLYYGNVTMDFCDNGNLIYTIIEDNKEKKIFMTYEINDNVLITDQVSHPQKMQTMFFLDTNAKKLELIFDNIKSKYIRLQ